MKSALLLAGLNAPGITRIEEPEATRDHSENMLRHFGATVNVEIAGGGRIISLVGQPELRAADVIVPGDISSAAFPLVAALLVAGSEVRIIGAGLNPLRAGLLLCLEEMGAAVTVENRRLEGGEPVGDLLARFGALRAIDVPAERAPSMIDEYPILAVAAAFAEGTTRMEGLEELRVKESDRLAAIAQLRLLGVDIDITGDGFVIRGTAGRPLGPGRIVTHGDHRIAMAFAVAGLIAPGGVVIDGAECVDVSFPGFFERLAELGAGVEVL